MAQVLGSLKLTLHYPQSCQPQMQPILWRLTPFFAPSQEGREPAYIEEANRILGFNPNGWMQPSVRLTADGGLERREQELAAEVQWRAEGLCDGLSREELLEGGQAWQSAIERYLDGVLGALVMCESGIRPRFWVEPSRCIRFEPDTEAALEEREAQEAKEAGRELAAAHRTYERSRL